MSDPTDTGLLLEAARQTTAWIRARESYRAPPAALFRLLDSTSIDPAAAIPRLIDLLAAAVKPPAPDPTDTPDMAVRYGVLLGENSRLRGEIARLEAEVKALRPPPEPMRPRTFGDDTLASAQERYNHAMTAEVNRAD